MQPSQLLFDLLESFEGYKSNAYLDQTGTPTIGYGTVYYNDGTAVKMGDTCTKEEAQQYLAYHLRGLSSHISVSLPNITQCEFDSLIDFAYQEGQGAFDGSTLKKTVAATPTDYDIITANFLVWDKERIEGVLQESDGILRRKKCDAYLYQNGVNAPNFFLNVA